MLLFVSAHFKCLPFVAVAFQHSFMLLLVTYVVFWNQKCEN